jgi:hypothetical protein
LARYALDAVTRATKGKLIAVNATGCLEVFSTLFPGTSWWIAWLHSLFGNAPAVASGVAAALKALGRTDIRVVAQGGDGGTVDVGPDLMTGHPGDLRRRRHGPRRANGHGRHRARQEGRPCHRRLTAWNHERHTAPA